MHRILLPVPASVLLLALIGAAGAPWAFASEEELLTLAVRSSEERSGDLDTLAAKWLGALPAHAGDFRAEIFLRRLSGLRPGLRDEMALLPLAEKALQADYASGVVREMLVDLVSDLYRRSGREEERTALEKDRGFVLQWLIVGPFGKGKSSAFARSFAPEESQRLEDKYTDGWQELTWRKLIRSDPQPLVRPLEHFYPSNGVAYLLTHVRSERDLEGVLQRGTADTIQVWLNGDKVVDDDPRAARLENRRASGVRLAKGWNRILVKARSPFWVRLADPAARPFPPGTLTEETGLQIHEPAAAARWEGPFRAGALVEWATWVKDLESAPGEAPGDDRKRIFADAATGLAHLYLAYGRDELAVEAIEKALAALPGDAMLLYHAGHVYRNAEYLPATVAKNRAQTAYDQALKADPKLVPAYERAARFLADDEKPAKAAAKVKEGLALEPRFLPGLERLQSIYARKKWREVEIETVREIEAVAPAALAPALFWHRHYSQLDNPAEAAARTRKAIEGHRGSLQLYIQLAEAERSRGGLKEAENAYRQALRLEPDNAGLIAELAENLESQERYQEALELARGLADRNPLHPKHQERIAALLEKLGEKEAALDARKQAYELDPGDLELGRYLAQRAGKAAAGARPDPAPEFWAPYDEKVEDWILQIPQDGPLVQKAESITVLDIMVHRIARDGSYSEYVHQASKVLTEEAKDDLANVRTQGEVVTLRTMTPSGETLEPVAAEGEGAYVMPSVTAGAVVEYAYRRDNERQHGRELRSGNFFFQDFRSKQSFLLSRYVAILPKGFDATIVETNLGADSPFRAQSKVPFARVEKTTRELPDGSTAVIYEARQVPRLEREAMMPSQEEYFPNVELAGASSWDEVYAQLRAGHRGSTLPTPELAAEARKATEGLPDPFERARALYLHVNRLVPAERGPSQAVNVLLEKAGNRTVLYKALLDLAGVPCRWAFVRPPEAALPRFDWSHPSAGAFPFPFVAIEVPGHPLAFASLSQRGTPFGRLPEHLGGGKALILGEVDERIIHLDAPDLEESAISTAARLKLADSLDVDVDVELSSRSFTFYALKDQLRTLQAFQKDQALRQLASRSFPGAKVKSGDMLGIDDPEKPLSIVVSMTAPKLLKKSGKEHLLKSSLQPSLLVPKFSGRSTREHPFHLRSQMILRESLDVDAGTKYQVSRVPEDVVLPCALGTFSLVYRREGSKVRVERQLTLLPGRLSPEEFPAFVQFCERVDAAERESLIYRKS